MNRTTPQIHIASFVALTARGGVARVLPSIENYSEIEVVTSDTDCKVVFLVEASHEKRIVEIVDAIRDLPSVLSVSMVEHHVDALDAMSEPLV